MINKKGFTLDKVQRLNSGFTLIELLIVIAILGVLASGVFIAINPLQKLQQARNAQRKMDLGSLANALEAYAISHNGQYPTTNLAWCGLVGSYYDCGQDWIPGLVISGELKTLPKDPKTGQSFLPCNNSRQVGYLYLSNGTDYKLLDHCGPECSDCTLGGDTYKTTDPFYDPTRPTWAWQHSSSGGAGW